MLPEGTDDARENVRRGSRGGNLRKYGKTVNTGARGRIAPRNFFGLSGHAALSKAVENLSNMIDTELEAILNKKN